MADRLNALRQGAAGAVMSALVLGGWAAAASAQLPDPTRPAGGAQSADPATGAAVVETGVKAVFLRPGEKPAALIDGEYVVQGGKLGDKRVLKISENEVVLRDAAGQKETLKVITGAEKKSVVQKAAAGKKSRGDGARSAPDEGATKK
jgi:hypothetical protein